MLKFAPCNCVYLTCISLEKLYRVHVSPHAFDSSMPGHGRLGSMSTGSLRHGIQEGVNNMGNKRVVADSSRCIGCQTCMAACIEAHDIPGNIAAPRLRVTRTYEISAPVACHHCEDAPCAKACPTGALFFDPKEPSYRRQRGQLHRLQELRHGMPLWRRERGDHAGSGLDGRRSRGFADQRASCSKCDLCVDRPGGPACAEACPTRASPRRRGAPGRTDCRACPRHHRKRGVSVGATGPMIVK